MVESPDESRVPQVVNLRTDRDRLAAFFIRRILRVPPTMRRRTGWSIIILTMVIWSFSAPHIQSPLLGMVWLLITGVIGAFGLMMVMVEFLERKGALRYIDE